MRKPRNSGVSDKELLTPFNVLDFGSDKDPCFGKLYSLTADECLACGDLELCAIVFQNSQKDKRKKLEGKLLPLDVQIDEKEYEKDIKDYIKRLKKRGVKGLLLRKRTQARFYLDNKQITKYL